MPHDANDYLKRLGEDGLRDAIDQATKVVPFSTAGGRMPSPMNLALGSDVEIADRVAADLENRFGQVLVCREQVHVWAGKNWCPLDQPSLREAVVQYDGALYPTAKGSGRVKLTQHKVKSILELMLGRLENPDAFKGAPIGISCKNGFLSLGDGNVILVPHAPEQKCLACLPVEWRGTEALPPEKHVLIDQLLNGVFQDDPETAEKIALIEELLGLAVFGGTMSLARPKAVVFIGPGAENGKSQVLEVIAGLVPEAFKSNLSPAQVGDEKLVLALDGARLNHADEIAGKAIYSERFKSIITGQSVTGRSLYSKGRSFRPEALNIFSANTFPAFTDGMDAGVRRRLLPVGFNRIIPEGEQIPKIAEKIVEHEPHALLLMAVRGSLRLFKTGALTEPASSKLLLAEWLVMNDPVEAWLLDPDAVQLDKSSTKNVLTKHAYRNFRVWCDHEGIQRVQQMTRTKFTQALRRSKLVGPVKHTNRGSAVTGLILKPESRT
jgi:phage/plasmid-associated DNA primase